MSSKTQKRPAEMNAEVWREATLINKHNNRGETFDPSESITSVAMYGTCADIREPKRGRSEKQLQLAPITSAHVTALSFLQLIRPRHSCRTRDLE